MSPRFNFLDDDHNLKYIIFDVNHNQCIIVTSRVSKSG